MMRRLYCKNRAGNVQRSTLEVGRFPQLRFLAVSRAVLRAIVSLALIAGHLTPALAGDAHGDPHPAAAKATEKAATPSPAAHTPEHAAPAPVASTNSPSPASQLDSLISTNLVKLKTPPAAKAVERVAAYQEKVEIARELRRKKDTLGAARELVALLENEIPAEFKRAALFELALVAQEENQLTRALQILAQYLQLFPKDPTVPEVILRQGLIYRQLGAHQLAISKFYAVMNSALNMKLDQFDYYERIVLQAQTEIADTQFLQGQFTDAATLYTRLLKQKAAELNRPFIHLKLLRCLAGDSKHPDVVSQAELFETSYPEIPEVAEVRFLHAQSLKQLGRTRESLEQIGKLLEAQRAGAKESPEAWVYWRQRIGNSIANQLYQEGDYLNALELYTGLAELDTSPGWQLPAWYQLGLIHERLDQPQKAAATYDAILAREKEITGTLATPGLKAVLEMTRWRKDHLDWQKQTGTAVQSLRLDLLHHPSTNAPHLANP